MKNSKEKGSALILVLLVVAILTAVGVNAVDRLQADINRSVDFIKMSSKNKISINTNHKKLIVNGKLKQ